MDYQTNKVHRHDSHENSVAKPNDTLITGACGMDGLIDKEIESKKGRRREGIVLPGDNVARRATDSTACVHEKMIVPPSEAVRRGHYGHQALYKNRSLRERERVRRENREQTV